MEMINPGSVTMSLEDYDELNSAYQNQDPMTRQERVDSTLQVTAICTVAAVTFVAASGTYYWLKDRYERRSLARKAAAAGETPIQDIPAP